MKVYLYVDYLMAKFSSLLNFMTVIITIKSMRKRKRVSNVLYPLCETFSESHAPRIQLASESARFRYLIVGMASSASEQKCNIERKCQKNVIQNEHSSRVYHKNHEKHLYFS